MRLSQPVCGGTKRRQKNEAQTIGGQWNGQGSQRDIQIFVSSPQRIRHWPQSTSRFAEYMVFLTFPISSSIVLYTSSFSTLAIFERIVGRSQWPQCGAMVGKTHLFEYTAHEVPLPLFGLGYDWACTFLGAPLPNWGKHAFQSSLL